MNKKTFSDVIEILEAGFSVKLNKDTSKIYWDILNKYDDNVIKKVTVKCVKELKFFPKISEIIEAIEGNNTDETELAWISLLDKIERIGHYQSVSFPEYPAIGAVVEAMGGWLSICETTFEEEKWVKKEFVKLYPILKRRGEYPNKLIGQFELDNGNRYTEQAMLDKYGRHLDGTKADRELLNNNSTETDRKLLNKGGSK